MRYAPLPALGVAAVALAGCGSDSGSGETTGSSQMSLSATEYSFDPRSIQIDQPGTYTFTLTNDGSTEHALEIEGQGVEEEIDELSPENSGRLTVTFSKTGPTSSTAPSTGTVPRAWKAI